MSLNLTCCKEFNLTSLICCKQGGKTTSPTPSPTPSMSFSLGKVITIVDSPQVKFENLIPSHKEYLYLKILSNYTVISLSGELLDDLDMTISDILGKTICEIKRNGQLFKECICPLLTQSIKTGDIYQFCFTIDATPRIITCTIYPCPTPEGIHSADCIIRPSEKMIDRDDLDRFRITTI